MNQKKSSTHEKNNLDSTAKTDSNVLYTNETRMKLYALLFVFKELSLSEICDYIDKSKSSIHRHLQIMIDAKLVKESREKKVRGPIYAKYYTLRSTQPEKPPSDVLAESKKPKKYLGSLKKLIESLQASHALLEYWTQKYEEYIDYLKSSLYYPAVRTRDQLEKEDLQSIQDVIDSDNFGSYTMFFSSQEYKEYKKLFDQFWLKIGKMKQEIDDKASKKEYVVNLFNLPILKILEMEKKRKKAFEE